MPKGLQGATALALFLTCWATPAAAAPVIGSPFEVDPAVVRSPLPWEQYESAIASSGSGHLVVWRDGRRGTATDLYAARIDASGTVVDLAGFPVALDVGPGDGTSPAVAFGGGVYLAVWVDPTLSTLRAARIGTNGAVLDPAGINLGSLAVGRPAVGFDGTNFLIVFTFDGPTDQDIFGLKVTPTGTLASAAFSISMASGPQDAPAISCSTSSCLVVWTDRRGASLDLYGTRVAPDGTVTDGVVAGLAIATTASDERLPSVSFGSSEWLVGWNDGSTGKFARVDISGAVVAGQSLPALAGTRMALTSNGTIFLACYPTNGALGCQPVGTDGSVAGGTELRIATSSSPDRLASASGSGSFLLSWTQAGPFTDSDVLAATIDSAGSQAGAPFAVSSAANVLDDPAVAWGNEGYLVAWSDYRDGGADIFARRVSATGALLDSGSIQLSDTPSLEWDSGPSVAFGGGNYLVTWVDAGSDIFAALVSGSGAAIRPASVLTNSQARARPQVVFDGTGFLVAYADNNTDTVGDVMGIRVDTAGVPAGAPFALAAGEGAQGEPTAAFDGQKVVVVFVDGGDLASVRVSAGGGPEAAAVPLLTAASRQSAPAVGCANGQCMAAWLDDRSGQVEVFATRFDGAGMPLDGTGIRLGASRDNSKPGVRFEGWEYFCTWRTSTATTSEIRGSRVDTLGTVVDDDLLLYSGLQTAGRVALGSDGFGGALVVFEAFSTAADKQVNRIFGEVVTFGPSSPPQANLTQAEAATEGTPVTLSAQATGFGSNAPAFEWDLGDGTLLSGGATVQHVYADEGRFTVNVRALGSGGAEAQATLELDVANSPPVPQAVGQRRAFAGFPFSLQLSAQDPGALDTLSWTLLDGPGSLSPEGRFDWIPEPKLNRDYAVRVQVADNDGGTAELEFTVRVGPMHFLISCGTVAAEPLWPVALLLLALAWRRRCV